MDDGHDYRDPQQSGPTPGEGLIDDDAVAEAFEESLDQLLDLDTWRRGEDLVELYAHLEEQIRRAVEREDRYRVRLRELILPILPVRPGAPPGAGTYQVAPERLEQIHRGLLFNGAVEACDGTSSMHDSLPLTIIQLGVALVSYRGDQGTLIHQLFRKDLPMESPDPTESALELLDRRRRRAAIDHEDARDRLTALGRRGLMTYAERAVLLSLAKAPWRMGHGGPVPLELLTGLGSMGMVERSLAVLRQLLLDHRRWVFVSSEPVERMVLTIGNALRPLEYAIVDTLDDRLHYMVDKGHYTRRHEEKVRAFVDEVGTKLVVGVYRASAAAPPQVFYAHVEHAHEAALIALADSTLQEHRGFPVLLDLADRICDATFGNESLQASVRVAYSAAGAPTRYFSERQTRTRG